MTTKTQHTAGHSSLVKNLLAALFVLVSVVGADAQIMLSDQAGLDTSNLEIHADVSDFDHATGVARASGDVIVKLDSLTIESQEFEFSQASGMIRASGDVRLFKGEQVINAEEIFYNVNTKEVNASHIRSALEPFYYEGEKVIVPEGEGRPITMENATITTDDSPNPDYRITAKKITVHPESRVVIRGAKFKVGDRTVMALPFYIQPLNGDVGYKFTPGWSSAWGGYVLNQYGFALNDDHIATAKLDYRSERGVAGGLDIKDRRSRFGGLSLYYIQDKSPQTRFNGQLRPANATPDNERYRVNLQHRVYVPSTGGGDFYVDADINARSDRYVDEDFYPNDFRIDPKPDNVVSVTRTFDRGEASVVGRFDPNGYNHTDTRLEGALDIIRTPLGDSGAYYSGLTSYGRLDEQLGEDTNLGNWTDANGNRFSPNSYNRFSTYHEVLFPQTVDGWLNVVPRAGIGYRNYSNFDIAGLDSFDSATYHAGIDLSFKLSKRDASVQNELFGIDGLMHVAQPYLNYSVTGAKEINGRFAAVDRYIPTTRLRSIDLPTFTAVDAISDWNVLRGGISNRWYTRRNGANYKWLSIDNYLEAYFEDPEFDRQFSNFYTDIAWTPVSWFGFRTTAQLPIEDNQYSFTELSSFAHFMPVDDFRFSIGHFYLSGHETIPDANLLSFNTYTRLGADWGVSTGHRYDIENSQLNYQQYALHKDLGSWVGRVGGSIRNHGVGDPEYGLFLSLTLKAFPKVSIPIDYQPTGGLGL